MIVRPIDWRAGSDGHRHGRGNQLSGEESGAVSLLQVAR